MSQVTKHAVQANKPASAESGRGNAAARIALAWLFVSIPLAWGIFETLRKAAQLFK